MNSKEKNNPLVSVNMVVYNGEKYISEAIKSILNQTYKNFEFIIVNDGSADLTEQIIKSFSDKRIKYYEHDKNYGEPFARNTAIKKSNGKYIAILDADDISFPTRFKEQVDFLEKNNEYGLIGGIAEIINEKGKSQEYSQSRSYPPEDTKVLLLFRNCFTPSSFMCRTEELKKIGFNNNRFIACDYEMAVKFSRISKIYNLDKILIQYRKHSESILATNRDKQIFHEKEIIMFQLSELGISPTKHELFIHQNIRKKNYHKIDSNYYDSLDWLDKLYNSNENRAIFTNPEFYNRISGYWFNLINNPIQYNIKLLKPYYSSPILRASNRSFMDHLFFTVKCIFITKNKNDNDFL